MDSYWPTCAQTSASPLYRWRTRGRSSCTVTTATVGSLQPRSNWRNWQWQPQRRRRISWPVPVCTSPIWSIGGVCSNNPALLGVVEAFGFSRASFRGVIPPRDIGILCAQHLAVLSVETGEQPDTPFASQTLRGGGTLAWGRQFHNVAIESQSQLTHVLAQGLLGHAYHRINPRLGAPMDLDDVGDLAALDPLAELTGPDKAFIHDYLCPITAGRSAEGSVGGTQLRAAHCAPDVAR